MMTVSARTFRLALVAPMIALGGCVSLGGAEPPASLLTITPATSAAIGEATAVTGSNALVVAVPEVPAKLDTPRIPVQVNDTEIAYLQDAFWIEKPARLFRKLVGETIRAGGGILVVDSDDTPIVAGQALRGTLREFGYDARSSTVVVQFDAIRSIEDPESEGGKAFETRRFEAVEDAVLPEADAVGPALNRAANKVAGEIAAWIAE